MHVAEAVSSRRSVRAFSDEPVPLETIWRVLDQARFAPSGCNFQPWEAIVLTGEPLRALQRRLSEAAPDDPYEYDFSAPGKLPKYQSRLRALGSRMYSSVGVAQDDREARAALSRRNLTGFGAPVLLLCHFPKLMKEAQWSDVGMWLQTIMLLLRGEGLDSCPQEFMGIYGRTIKAELGLGDDILLFCGLAIGVKDNHAPINGFERERVALSDHVEFRGFD